MNRRALLAGLAATGAALSLPAQAQFSMDKLMQGAAKVGGAFMASEGDEVQLGENYYQPLVQKSGGAYPDRNAQEALKRFAAPLLASADRKSLPWEVTLIDSDQVNAWALPGGKLAINSALVKNCSTPDELASVIAHEVGHADKGHSLSQIRNEALLTTVGGLGKDAVASWLGGSALTAQVMSAIEAPLYNLVLNGYSRTNEFEADQHILSIFGRTGYDPTKADDFFHTLMRIYPQSASETTSLFSTHPGTKERISKIEAAAKRAAKPSTRPAAPGWAELKSILPTPKS
ncbi:MAG: M48 family metallopeptidase [Alphaproteobacteria bacterium]|nr:M48 family metallopeptidase [Alphaproteobacteria bacterium]